VNTFFRIIISSLFIIIDLLTRRKPPLVQLQAAPTFINLPLLHCKMATYRSGTEGRSCFRVSVSAEQECSLQCTKFDEDDGSPVAAPLDSLEAVLSWQPGLDDLCVPVVPLKDCPAIMQDPHEPKVIVCHDMMGGYRKDSFVQGHRSVFTALV